MPPTHHDPDHTAHIRHQLAQLAITGTIGLVIATLGGGALLLVDALTGPLPATTTRIAWITVATAAAVALLTLATSAALWIVHQRHRAEVDARGAETAREINAATAAQNRSDREPM